MFALPGFEDKVYVVLCEVALDKNIFRQLAGFLDEFRIVIGEEKSFVQLLAFCPLLEETILKDHLIFFKNIDHESNAIQFFLKIRTQDKFKS